MEGKNHNGVLPVFSLLDDSAGREGGSAGYAGIGLRRGRGRRSGTDRKATGEDAGAGCQTGNGKDASVEIHRGLGDGGRKDDAGDLEPEPKEPVCL